MTTVHHFVDEFLDRCVAWQSPDTRLVIKARLDNKVQACLAYYNQDDSLFRVASGVADVARRLFGHTLWSETKELMKPHARAVIMEHFCISADAKNLDFKVDALTEFFLRFIIMKDRKSAGKSCAMIDESEWVREQMDYVSVEELIERAPKGNGYHLPPLDLNELKLLLNATHMQFSLDIDIMVAAFPKQGWRKLFKDETKDALVIAFVELDSVVEESDLYLESLDWVTVDGGYGEELTADDALNVLSELRGKATRFHRYVIHGTAILQMATFNDLSTMPDHYLPMLELARERMGVWVTVMQRFLDEHPEPTFSIEEGNTIIQAYNPVELAQLVDKQTMRWKELALLERSAASLTTSPTLDYAREKLMVTLFREIHDLKEMHKRCSGAIGKSETGSADSNLTASQVVAIELLGDD